MKIEVQMNIELHWTNKYDPVSQKAHSKHYRMKQRSKVEKRSKSHLDWDFPSPSRNFVERPVVTEESSMTFIATTHVQHNGVYFACSLAVEISRIIKKMRKDFESKIFNDCDNCLRRI